MTESTTRKRNGHVLPLNIDHPRPRGLANKPTARIPANTAHHTANAPAPLKTATAGPGTPQRDTSTTALRAEFTTLSRAVGRRPRVHSANGRGRDSPDNAPRRWEERGRGGEREHPLPEHPRPAADRASPARHAGEGAAGSRRPIPAPQVRRWHAQTRWHAPSERSSTALRTSGISGTGAAYSAAAPAARAPGTSPSPSPPSRPDARPRRRDRRTDRRGPPVPPKFRRPRRSWALRPESPAHRGTPRRAEDPGPASHRPAAERSPASPDRATAP